MSDDSGDEWKFSVEADDGQSTEEKPKKKRKYMVRGKERSQKLKLDVPKDGVPRKSRSQYYEEDKKVKRKKKKKKKSPIKKLLLLIIVCALGYWLYNNVF